MSDALSVGSATQKAVTVGVLSAPALLNSVVPLLPSALTFISTLLAIIIGIMTIFKLRRDAQLAKALLRNANKDAIIKDEKIKSLKANIGHVRRDGDPDPEVGEDE